MSCFVRQAEGRAFSDPLIGLKVSKDGVAMLCPQAFSCCGSSQCRVDSEGNLFVCDIDLRLRKVQKLLDLYKQVWKAPFQGFGYKNQPTLQQFFSFFIQSGSVPVRGQIFQSRFPHDKASPYIWLMAIIAAWRFSSEVHVITLGKTKASGLLPDADSFRGGGKRPLVFVDQKEPLRLPHVEFDFDVIVNWCEGSMVPLWMDVYSEPDRKPVNTLTGSAEEQFRKRIERYRRSPPLSWIYADTCSRLSNISIGLERFC